MAIRITGGSLVRRFIRVPKSGVRPTQDRVRAAVFSSLAERIPGARVLDLFAGSGAMGLEAYSRGAASVCWVESDRRILAVLKDNIRQLCGPESAGGGDGLPARPEPLVVADEVLRFIRKKPVFGPFDIIFEDPPYDQDGEWLKKILYALSEVSILAPSGSLVIELSARISVVSLSGWKLLKTREYGETRICILTKG
ncbi:MAG: 16S rRNA (guanine(966)-N(2))-methyltransferase RsmD [Verrucomicrobia bacterium]|nr:16S rRNA (guanine(966)-N(2))-methyltransferase RsmD [Verrucomicrobiota bacterium]